MRIRLPLTLAIIDGFLVGVGSSSFVIPLDRVTECLELMPDAHARDCTYLRGGVLPLIRLRSLFGIAEPPPRRQSVVVVEDSGQCTGLVVDSLLGQFQTVIKPLGVLFGHVKCVGGATILGNGEVALILDVGPLVAGHTSMAQARDLARTSDGGSDSREEEGSASQEDGGSDSREEEGCASQEEGSASQEDESSASREEAFVGVG